jgi:AraC family transcriptional regulator, regulatory protein of adaptative response / methylated-DNA-[protein]-cysteine methyltransferase
MLAGATDSGICLLEFVERRGLPAQIATLRRRFALPIAPGEHPHLTTLRSQLAQYFAATTPRHLKFDLSLDVPATPFQTRVWNALREIPPGHTRAYAHIARLIQEPTATRAVARANGDNRIAIIIPCHRVIGSNGDLTGYAGKIWRKQWLLDHESRVTGTNLWQA